MSETFPDPEFYCALSELMESGSAVEECLRALEGPLAGRRPDLVLAFVSPHHRDSYALIQETLLGRLEPRALAGCTGGGVIGAARELEEVPGLSVTAAVLPGVRVAVRHVSDEDLPGPDEAPRAWEDAVGARASDGPGFLALVSPFMSRAEELLAGLDYAFPRSPKVGGVASGLRHVGERALFWDAQRLGDGALVVSLSGRLRMEALVAQGCRPVGPLFTVTACRGNVLEGLDGRPAARALRSVFEAGDARTRDLLQRALFVGLVGDELGPGEPGPGDFLVRNVLGFDQGAGQIAVAAFLREGMRLRFHVRDADAADEDLRKVIERHRAASGGRDLAGGLLFSCVGRGERLFGEPDHDSRAFADAYGCGALAGFFCNGEVGPVGKGTFLHGFTSCFALFSRP